MNIQDFHPRSNSSTCKHEKFVGPAHSLVLHHTFFYGAPLSEHFSYPNTPWSQRVRITEVRLYSQNKNHTIKTFNAGTSRLACLCAHLRQEDDVVLCHQNEKLQDDWQNISLLLVEWEELNAHLQDGQKEAEELLDEGDPRARGKTTHGLQQRQKSLHGLWLPAARLEVLSLNQCREP